ncbi:MAG: hypothetical protein H7247_00400 [Polaromonas sp.]|nr:hypothetical protein [Gemmatimonadaceae bacterium]
MSQLEITEIVPGLVVRLDTAQLRTLGGSQTNAQRSETEDRAVSAVHDFCVVSVDATKEHCVAIPLFARSSPGSAPLEAKKQWGNIEGWLTETVHYSRWQHWRMPLASVVATSGDDPGAVGARRSYAAGDADTLQDLLNWASRNRCEFRDVTAQGTA